MLEALGLNVRDIFSAEADRHGGIVGILSLLDATPGSGSDGPGRMARFTEGVFQTDTGTDDTDLHDKDGWLDLAFVNEISK